MVSVRPPLTIVTLVTFGLLEAAGSAAGQHAPMLDGVAPPEYQGCGMCHGAHGNGSDTRMLRVDDRASIDFGQSRVGNISRSCLRCHSTAADRMQQPEFRSGSGSLDRALLGFDLTDDHPIGGSPADDPFSGSVLDDVLRAPIGGRLESLATFGDASVECTTCHDPHDRSGPLPRLEEEVVLCTSCHEGGRYAFSSHQEIPCSGCHSLHGGHGRSLLRDSSSDAVCTSCHSGAGIGGLTAGSELGSGRLRALASIVGSSAPGGHATPSEGRCVDCHAVHE